MSFIKKILLVLAAAIAFAVLFLNVPSSEPRSGNVEIKMTADGFLPQEVTIRRGTKVHFASKDKVWRWPASDLHPTHNINPKFDPRAAIKPGDTWEFVFADSGEFPYHDHLAPYITGKIIVVE